MNINNENVNIDDLISQKYMHKEVKKGIFLSDYQIDILKRYNIDVNSIGSINELIFQIDELLNEDPDADELDIILNELMEYNYYCNTNK